MIDVLANCPFCGNEPTPDYSSIIGEDSYHFHCQSSDCPAWPNVSGATEAEAITAWNTRAPSPDMAEAVGLIQRLGEGWDNAVELGLIPERHRNTAQILGDEARAFLARVGAA